MSNFTPGPWEAGLARMNEPDKRNIWAVSLQVASTKSPWIKQEIQEANANLIAAAPEMYEALKGLVEWAEAVDRAGVGPGLGRDYQASLNALSKADGAESKPSKEGQ